MRTARARWASGTRSVPVGGRDLVGAALAGVVLVGLVIGLPLLLGTVAPLSAAEVSELSGVLARPADGTLLRLVLTVSAWSGWAVFTLSVVLEAGAVLRRRPTPRIPLLAGPQRSAAALIAAVSLLLVPASAPAGPPPRSVVPAHGAPGPDAAPPVGGPRHGPDLVDRAVPPTGSGAHRPKPARTYPTVVVVRHDTLWRLAERHLGSGLRYREIVELNRGRPQPDGGSLTDPHWIYPGWELRLPNDARGPGLRRAADVPRPVTVDRGPAAASPAPVDRAPAAAVPRPRPAEIDTATGSSATQPRDGSSWLAAAAPTVDSDPVQPLPLLALGLGSVTVAAVLAELARQRRSRQRIRRSGERIAMPTGEVAAAERELRSLPDACAERVRAAMAHLVDGCAAAGRELPQVAVVRVRPEAIELVLAVDEPEPVAPFDHAAERVWSWSGPLVTPPPSADRVDPCPALLSVGIDGGDLVLVNLEAAGTLRVLAPPEQAVPVVAALSIDLTTAARGGRVSLAV
ncbi:MAG TPA: LysM peptidoglycan-binding domain-containing protein, partial [Candidatus Nanopelagicales bacterium]|nr:LysM peptidoglycan-binding domain-containing protein [Candidatus Nanopelagicales bacterium]